MEGENTDAEVPCEHCGRPEGIGFGHRVLCAACLSEAGSCCAEFEADDECDAEA